MDDVHRIVTRDAKQRLDLASHGQGCDNDHRAAAQLVGLGTVSSERVAQKAANHHQDGSPLKGRLPIFHTLSLLDSTAVETRAANLLHFDLYYYCTIDRAEIQYPISCYLDTMHATRHFCQRSKLLSRAISMKFVPLSIRDTRDEKRSGNETHFQRCYLFP